MKIKLYLTVLLLSLTSTSLFANQISEVEGIKRVLHEVQAINPIIQQAQENSDRQERDRFNYRCLVQDLNIFKHGLKAAVHAVRHIPRQYQALCSDYGYAGQYGEEARSLSILINELQALKPLLNEAKEYRDPYSRVSLNYEAIHGDLDTIIYAIQIALTGSGDTPRKFPPLRGAFSQ